jgi:flagellar biogenesis protein FliO
LKIAARLVLIVAAILLAANCHFAAGQTPLRQPPAQTPASEESIESHSLDAGGAEAANPESAAPGAPNGNSFDVLRVILSLAVVLGLIIALRVAARRILPGVARSRSSHAIKIVSRCPVSNRQNLLLVQVGRRLILVGDAGAQLTALSEFHEGSETEALLAQLREESSTTVSKFESLFGKAEAEFATANENQPESEGDAARDADTDGDVTADRSESFDSTSEIPNPSLQATQKEILGLSQKVRELARQLRD